MFIVFEIYGIEYVGIKTNGSYHGVDSTGTYFIHDENDPSVVNVTPLIRESDKPKSTKMDSLRNLIGKDITTLTIQFKD
jgi:hypothetical protein